MGKWMLLGAKSFRKAIETERQILTTLTLESQPLDWKHLTAGALILMHNIFRLLHTQQNHKKDCVNGKFRFIFQFPKLDELKFHQSRGTWG